MAQEIVGIKVEVDGSDVGKSVGSLKQQLRAAQNDVTVLSEKFGATSKEAIEAAKRAAQLKDAIGDAKALTDAFNPDAKFKALSASLSGVAGGFAAVQGALGLLGQEGEDVQKTLVKVQSALALSQGLQTIGESIDSFKQLGAVIQSTSAFQKINNALTSASSGIMKALGISVDVTSTSFKVLKGAIAATGIGLLVVAVGELVSALQSYQSAAEKAKSAQDDLNASIKKGADVGLEAELQYLENEQRIAIARAKQRGASEKEIFDIEQSFRASKAASQQRYWKEISRIDVEGASKAESEIKKIEADGIAARLDFETRQREAKKRRLEEEKQERERVIKEEKEARNKLYADEDRATQTRFVQSNFLRTKVYEDGILVQKTALDKSIELDTSAAQKSIQNLYALGDQKKKAAEADIKLAEAKRDAEIGAAQSALNIVSGLIDQNSVAGKAIAVVQAIINTYVGASKALAQGGIFGPVAAAATIAAGLVQVRKIVSTKIPSAKGTGSVANTGGGGGMTMASAPISPASPIQNTVTQLDQTSINRLGSATSRAYVVESDITNSQEKITRINRAARLG